MVSPDSGAVMCIWLAFIYMPWFGSGMQDSNLLSYKRQIYSLMCISRCTDSRYVRAVAFIYPRDSVVPRLRGFGNTSCAPGLFVAAVIPPIGDAALFYVIRPPRGRS